MNAAAQDQGIDMFRELAIVLFLALPMTGQTGEPEDTVDPSVNSMILTRGFMDAHPDLDYRNKGMHAYAKKRFKAAFQYFQRAAFYADKSSQGMLAEMLWNGEGLAKDHVLAYIWMDVAAERGYELLVQQRERYWSLLDAEEKTRIAPESVEIRSVYGDAAAKRRIAAVLRRARSNITGSHLGSTVGSALTISVPGPAGGSRAIDGSTYFDPQYWDPGKYQAWLDGAWKNVRTPKVDVGAVEQVSTTTSVHAPQSRLPEAAPDLDAEAPSIPEHEQN